MGLGSPFHRKRRENAQSRPVPKSITDPPARLPAFSPPKGLKPADSMPYEAGSVNGRHLGVALRSADTDPLPATPK